MLRTLLISAAPAARLTRLLLLLLTGLLISSSRAEAADAPSPCSPVIGRIVSRQGTVEVRRAGQKHWTRVLRGDVPICEGDQIRVGPLSRAAFMIGPDIIVRVDQNTTLSATHTDEEVTVELLPADIGRGPETRDVPRAAYVITREKRTFRVRTPFYSAIHEGTEFLVSAYRDRGELYVFEGKVTLEDLADPAERIRLQDGQATTIAPGETRAVRVLVKPPDAVQWTLYYPPVADPDAPDEEILARDCARLDPADACLISRAEALLRLGRVDEARAQIKDVLAGDPRNGDAKSLNAIIAIVRSEPAEALALAREATASAPGAFRPWIALSYAQQASFDLEAALDSAKRAVDVAPESALARARLAELLMSVGRIRDAESEARHAVKRNPKQSRAHAILGFVHLAQIDTKAARADFMNAIELDQSDPLPRLGLGLAIIRDGELAEGREQIEIAVALDPTNSLVRSYLGKAYYEENTGERDQFAATQFRLAKALDPKDPTAWFYDAILLQSRNRPVEALQDLQKSIELNDERAVYRSRLLLDQDLAARSTSLARTYQDLHFDALGVTEAGKSLAADFGDHSGHLFLADTYANLPRHSAASASEFLQSLLRQPVNVNPVAALRPVERASLPGGRQKVGGILRGLGPAQVTYNEFNPLFSRNGLSLYLDGLVGSEGTLGDQVVVTGIKDKVSFSLAQGYVHTDGFQVNTDFNQRGTDAFVQVALSPRANLQAEMNVNKFDGGEFLLPANLSLPSAVRATDETRNFRVGGLLGLDADANVLFSGIYQDRTVTGSTLDEINRTETDLEAAAAELQYYQVNDRFSFLAGMGYSELSFQPTTFVSGIPPLQFQASEYYTNAYLYGQVEEPKLRLRVNMGLSVDALRKGFSGRRPPSPLTRTEVNPKLGVIWNPYPATTVRAAIFKSVKRMFVANQSIEPTAVAGFNQFFDDSTGTLAWRYGIGLDQRVARGTHIGFEASQRDLRVAAPPPGSTQLADYNWRERAGRLYLYWSLPANRAQGIFRRWSWAMNAEYQYEELVRPPGFETGFEGFAPLKTQLVPIGFTAFPVDYLSLRFATTYISQSGNLQPRFSSSRFAVGGDFWVTDIGLVHRLPGRLGQLTVGVSNLFDEKLVRYQDTDQANPLFTRGRFVFARLAIHIW